METREYPKTVREVMQSHVVGVTPDTSLRRLVQLLSGNRISGVPVLDESGKILGVVSSSDVIRLAAREGDAGSAAPNEWLAHDPSGDGEAVPWYFTALDLAPVFAEDVLGSELEDYTVEDIMTPAAFTVAPDEGIGELARFLYRGRIHRALVVERGMLLGIVTPFDLLPILAEREMPLAV